MIHDSVTDHKNTSGSLQIGSIGWQHAHWDTAFYPEDLPADWRLTYYANEFSCVLLPLAALVAEELDVAQLCDDVPDGFTFYLLHEDAPWSSQLDDLAGAFGDRLGAIINDGGLTPDTDLPVLQLHAGNTAGAVWTVDQAAGSGVGMLALEEPDPRRWRGQLEAFRDQSDGNLRALFVSDQHPNMAAMQQLKTLVELMGL